MLPSLGDETVELLIAEDDVSARELMVAIFEEEDWARSRIVGDGVEAVQALSEKGWDLLITDLNMPRLGGEEVIQNALEKNPDITIIVITGNGTIDKAVKLMHTGVFDSITKPFSLDHFLGSVYRARERVLGINEVKGIREVVDALLAALESKDRYLNGHSFRVAKFAVGLGTALKVPRRQLEILEYAARLHDVGKIGIHEDILNKEGKLTSEEFEIMKTHPVLSRDIVAPIRFLQPCLPAVLHHHERIDGRGYPHGLAGDEIPFEARIISVVDSFDAMTSTRSYRPALQVERVLDIIEEVAGTQLDAEMARVFLDNVEEITGAEVRTQA